MWVEHLASSAPSMDPYPFPFCENELDFRPLLSALLLDRLGGRDRGEIARAFQRGIAQGLTDAINPCAMRKALRPLCYQGAYFRMNF
jgi:hydrogenase maturation protein HypF